MCRSRMDIARSVLRLKTSDLLLGVRCSLAGEATMFSLLLPKLLRSKVRNRYRGILPSWKSRELNSDEAWGSKRTGAAGQLACVVQFADSMSLQASASAFESHAGLVVVAAEAQRLEVAILGSR